MPQPARCRLPGHMPAAAARVLVGAALAAALGADEPPEPQIERLTGSPAIFSIKGFASPAECVANRRLSWPQHRELTLLHARGRVASGQDGALA